MKITSFFRVFLMAATLLSILSCGTYESHMKKAEAFLAIGEYYDAGEEFRRAYRMVPSKDKERRGMVSLKMGNAYYMQNSPQRAVGAYRNAVRYQVTDSLTHLRLGQMLMMTGDYKNALDIFEEGLDTMTITTSMVRENMTAKPQNRTTVIGAEVKQSSEGAAPSLDRKAKLKAKEQERKIKEKARKLRSKEREKLMKERAKQRKKGIKVGPMPPMPPLDEYIAKVSGGKKEQDSPQSLPEGRGHRRSLSPTLPTREGVQKVSPSGGDLEKAHTLPSEVSDTVIRHLDSGTVTLLKNGIKSATMAPEWKELGSPYTVKKDAEFNGRRSDYCPMLMGTEGEYMYFTSTRNEAEGDEYSGITGIKCGDIFFSQKNDKGKWSKPAPVAGGVNTEFDEGATCASPDNSTIYLTQCVYDPSYPRYAQIMQTNRSDASWGKATKVELSHDTLSSFAHPAVSPDGEWLYFVSDMPGGMGGLDIWRIRLSQIGIGGVENVGAPINTPGDEMFPAFRPNGDLYFSSNGHPGMGGLDIFIAKAASLASLLGSSKNGQQSTANGQRPTAQPHNRTTVGTVNGLEHPGYPLNSMGDDFGITFEGVYNRGYFSSNRGDGKGWDHLYTFEKDEFLQVIKGWVYEADGYELPGSMVYLVGNDGTNLRLNVQTDGSFTQVINPNVDYVMLATCKGYLNHKEEIRVQPLKESKEYVLQFPLASISAPVLIDNIFFDFAKATLREESFPSLDKLVTLLNDNPYVTIELGSHTDYFGTDAFNDRLSQQRAQSVCDYLISKGIAKDRLTPKGYGEHSPKVVTKKFARLNDWLKEGDVLTEDFVKALSPEKQEICNQMNRRTEFRVLRTTYGMTH
ncbi:MAG: OmpA family protein [Bacteroidaceae bacterium]|nr:OmpA family protein [Bacteroidaceae bacterium]